MAAETMLKANSDNIGAPLGLTATATIANIGAPMLGGVCDGV